MPSLPGRYAQSALREAGAIDAPRSAWSAAPVERAGTPPEPGAPHLCEGGCGRAVPTAKCTACATAAVGRWLAARDAAGARLAARYYGIHPRT